MEGDLTFGFIGNQGLKGRPIGVPIAFFHLGYGQRPHDMPALRQAQVGRLLRRRWWIGTGTWGWRPMGWGFGRFIGLHIRCVVKLFMYCFPWAQRHGTTQDDKALKADTV
jgi:hypothetical protein